MPNRHILANILPSLQPSNCRGIVFLWVDNQCPCSPRMYSPVVSKSKDADCCLVVIFLPHTKDTATYTDSHSYHHCRCLHPPNSMYHQCITPLSNQYHFTALKHCRLHFIASLGFASMACCSIWYWPIFLHLYLVKPQPTVQTSREITLIRQGCGLNSSRCSRIAPSMDRLWRMDDATIKNCPV